MCYFPIRESRLKVFLTKQAVKSIRIVPDHVGRKLQLWIRSVSTVGLEITRKIPGYHDEPLKGKRQGQRSIRLSKEYRAIYRILEDNQIEFIQVEEVNKHEY